MSMLLAAAAKKQKDLIAKVTAAIETQTFVHIEYKCPGTGDEKCVECIPVGLIRIQGKSFQANTSFMFLVDREGDRRSRFLTVPVNCMKSVNPIEKGFEVSEFAFNGLPIKARQPKGTAE